MLPPGKLDKVLAYVGGQSSNGFVAEETDNRSSKAAGRGNRNRDDPETRSLVEKAAVDLVTRHYEAQGWEVESVEADNVGWDLNVVRSKRLLRVEVKGLSGTGSIELTPGEYRAMRADNTRMSYRLAVVRSALSAQPEITIFRFVSASDRWLSDSGHKLRIKEIMGAQMSF